LRLDLAIRQATERLQGGARGDARLDAETLLMHVLSRDRASLYAYPELELTPEELSRYNGMLERRLGGEPLQYITGHQEFWGLDLVVNPSVLIPRPETEHAVETALELLRRVEAPHIIDVGTGSGCIALALASELERADVRAVDRSGAALEVARLNARRLGLERIRFAQSDLLAACLPTGPAFDLVISNPPYVGEREADKLPIEVREHEPHGALFAGEEGLDIYRLLIPQAAPVLKPGGWLVLEMGYSQEPSLRELLDDWDEVRCVRDLQGIPRVIAARR